MKTHRTNADWKPVRGAHYWASSHGPTTPQNIAENCNENADTHSRYEARTTEHSRTVRRLRKIQPIFLTKRRPTARRSAPSRTPLTVSVPNWQKELWLFKKKRGTHRNGRRRRLRPDIARCVRPKRTNLRVTRLSLNRSQQGVCSTKYDTLTRTQVVYKWSSTSAPIVIGNSRDTLPPTSDGRRQPDVVARPPGAPAIGSAPAYRSPSGPRQRMHRHVSGLDSDLEAFSHNPSDGSFAPLAYQPSTWTKYLNLRFLSYWAGLPWQRRVISRVKLTCLTTV